MVPVEDSSKFFLAEVSEGDTFTYMNGGATVCGCVGGVHPHDGGSVHVVSDSAGHKVCVIRNNAPRIVQDNTIIVPLGERTAFAFQPSFLLT